MIRAVAAKRGPHSLDVGLGESSFEPDADLFARATAMVAERGCRYTPNAGDSELRERIAGHYGYPSMIHADNVCITAGAQEAIYAAIFGVLDPATDDVLIVEPVFGTYAKVAEFAGVRHRSVSLASDDGYAFDVAKILAAIDERTRLLVLSSPSNPTGRVVTTAQARALAAGLTAHSGKPILVLFDEVYRELRFTEDAANFAHEYSETIVVNSLSKSNALTGLRLGWAIAPKHLIGAITKAHIWATSCASTYAQYLALAIFREPKKLTEHFMKYQALRTDALAILAATHVPHTPIEGSFYTMVRPHGLGDSVVAAGILIERDDVLAIPGRAFGESGEGALRVSFAAPREVFAESIRRIAARFPSL